ncbi:22938_t:CDS:2, partial [Racocetra persica]
KDEVFGEELSLIIKKENSTNKLFDKMAENPKYEEAITDYTIDHKIRKINFGIATTIEVAQEYTATKTLQRTKRSFNTNKKELDVLSKRMVTINRSIVAYLYNQSGILLRIDNFPLLRYLSLNTHQVITPELLAISEVHNYIDGYPIGKHLDIVKFMITIQKSNPPPPAPDDTIDIISALDFIVSLGPNENMSILDLSCKTVFLIALGLALGLVIYTETNPEIENHYKPS